MIKVISRDTNSDTPLDMSQHVGAMFIVNLLKQGIDIREAVYNKWTGEQFGDGPRFFKVITKNQYEENVTECMSFLIARATVFEKFSTPITRLEVDLHPYFNRLKTVSNIVIDCYR